MFPIHGTLTSAVCPGSRESGNPVSLSMLDRKAPAGMPLQASDGASAAVPRGVDNDEGVRPRGLSPTPALRTHRRLSPLEASRVMSRTENHATDANYRAAKWLPCHAGATANVSCASTITSHRAYGSTRQDLVRPKASRRSWPGKPVVVTCCSGRSHMPALESHAITGTPPANSVTGEPYGQAPVKVWLPSPVSGQRCGTFSILPAS